MKTAHRLASLAKRRPLPQPSKFWGTQLVDKAKTTLRVMHWDVLTLFANGNATVDTLKEWIGMGLTYHRMLELLAADGAEFTPEARAALAEQVQHQPTVLRRYQATGRVGFTGPEYLAARAAACVVDSLLDLDRNSASLRAAFWSEQQLHAMQHQFTRGAAASTQPQPKDEHHV